MVTLFGLGHVDYVLEFGLFRFWRCTSAVCGGFLLQLLLLTSLLWWMGYNVGIWVVWIRSLKWAILWHVDYNKRLVSASSSCFVTRCDYAALLVVWPRVVLFVVFWPLISLLMMDLRLDLGMTNELGWQAMDLRSSCPLSLKASWLLVLIILPFHCLSGISGWTSRAITPICTPSRQMLCWKTVVHHPIPHFQVFRVWRKSTSCDWLLMNLLCF